ncbi:MAG: serine/threonine-protein kinase [Pirellulales bacterium]
MANSEELNDSELDQALAEYLAKCDSGTSPDRKSFLEQYPPEVREKLEHLLSAADWIEHLAGPSVAELARLDQNQSSAEIDSQVTHSIETLPLNESTKPKMIEHTGPILPCRFGDYELLKVIGRGGMGVVYYATQKHLDRPVAIKMIRSGALATADEVQRFYAEARSAAQLHHPNIVTVYQCGELDGHHYFSMDFVDGTDLDKLSKAAPLEPRRAAKYVRDVAQAIEFAHRRGILHRDLKPANVLVDQDDRVRITDFGLAKSVGRENGLTATGAALGTPSFMSPEQAAGRTEDQGVASDVYSLGAILFTLLAGHPPFKATSAIQTMMQVIHRAAPRLRTVRSGVPEDLETIVDKCLQKSPTLSHRLNWRTIWICSSWAYPYKLALSHLGDEPGTSAGRANHWSRPGQPCDRADRYPSLGSVEDPLQRVCCWSSLISTANSEQRLVQEPNA